MNIPIKEKMKRLQNALEEASNIQPEEIQLNTNKVKFALIICKGRIVSNNKFNLKDYNKKHKL